MPSWGIRRLAELQEDYSTREKNDCYSNYSETSGKGYTRVPPTRVWSVCPGGGRPHVLTMDGVSPAG